MGDGVRDKAPELHGTLKFSFVINKLHRPLTKSWSLVNQSWKSKSNLELKSDFTASRLELTFT